MGTLSVKKKRFYLVVIILFSALLAFIGASSQNFIIGGVFGFVLALAIDAFAATFKKKGLSTAIIEDKK